MARLLEGKPLAEKFKVDLQQQIQAHKSATGKVPVLASIEVGESPSSTVYINAQRKAAEELGVEYRLRTLAKNSTEHEFAESIEKLNSDPSVNGIIVQMPLPLQIDCKKVGQLIAVEKDVEGMHPQNLGKLFSGQAKIIPCTVRAVMELINASGIDLYGKDVVIVGHSEIVGKPLSLLLLNSFATVSVCHIGTSKSGKLEEYVGRAVVLIVAVGKPELIKGTWIQKDAVVIDVGINRVGDKIVGDVEFQEAQKRASWITPVPGGVGPLTVMMLLRNLVEAMKLQR